MDGEIALESAPGQGSRFFFTIPLAPASAPSESAEAFEGGLAGLHVLVVDDNERG